MSEDYTDKRRPVKRKMRNFNPVEWQIVRWLNGRWENADASREIGSYWWRGGREGADMEFVKNFAPSDFQAKNFTPSISSNFNSFSKKKHKKWVKMEKFTPLAKILHCRRQWRHRQIPPLSKVVTGQDLPTDDDGVVAILEAPDMPSEATVDPLLDIVPPLLLQSLRLPQK